MDVLRGDPCSFCPARTLDVDHIQPLNDGGSDSWPNMTGACSRCNRGRRDLDVLRFLARRLGR